MCQSHWMLAVMERHYIRDKLLLVASYLWKSTYLCSMTCTYFTFKLDHASHAEVSSGIWIELLFFSHRDTYSNNFRTMLALWKHAADVLESYVTVCNSILLCASILQFVQLFKHCSLYITAKPPNLDAIVLTTSTTNCQSALWHCRDAPWHTMVAHVTSTRVLNAIKRSFWNYESGSDLIQSIDILL